MYFRDRLRLPLEFDAALLEHDLAAAVRSGWIGHFLRQNYEGEWDVIPLRVPLGARRPAAMVLVNPMTEDFEDAPVLAACPYFREVLDRFRTALRAVRLLRLGPDSMIKEHADPFIGIEEGLVRLHIPIITNPGVDFRLNGTRLEMAPGTAWYFAADDLHSVSNGGATDRVHLVVDAVLNAWLVELMETAERSSQVPGIATN
jgi:hypothetical protein